MRGLRRAHGYASHLQRVAVLRRRAGWDEATIATRHVRTARGCDCTRCVGFSTFAAGLAASLDSTLGTTFRRDKALRVATIQDARSKRPDATAPDVIVGESGAHGPGSALLSDGRMHSSNLPQQAWVLDAADHHAGNGRDLDAPAKSALRDVSASRGRGGYRHSEGKRRHRARGVEASQDVYGRLSGSCATRLMARSHQLYAC